MDIICNQFEPHPDLWSYIIGYKNSDIPKS